MNSSSPASCYTLGQPRYSEVHIRVSGPTALAISSCLCFIPAVRTDHFSLSLWVPTSYRISYSFVLRAPASPRLPGKHTSLGFQTHRTKYSKRWENKQGKKSSGLLQLTLRRLISFYHLWTCTSQQHQSEARVQKCNQHLCCFYPKPYSLTQHTKSEI